MSVVSKIMHPRCCLQNYYSLTQRMKLKINIGSISHRKTEVLGVEHSLISIVQAKLSPQSFKNEEKAVKDTLKKIENFSIFIQS